MPINWEKLQLRCAESTVTDENLFNLKYDPEEHHDLMTSMPEETKKLQKKLSDWEVEMAAPRLEPFKKNQ
jgi:hypothetical protein